MPINGETKPAVMALFDHVKNHDWEPLKDFREFRGDQDNAIAYAVTGPHDGGMVILISDPVELYAGAEIYLAETITAEEVSTIKGLVAEDDWNDL
jgi:hypothetical protein